MQRVLVAERWLRTLMKVARVVEFMVMIRPLTAIHLIRRPMAAMLQSNP